MDGYAVYHLDDTPEEICEECGWELMDSVDHEPCGNVDLYSCHSSEYAHMAEREARGQ